LRAVKSGALSPHPAPYIEDLLAAAATHVAALQSFVLGSGNSSTTSEDNAILALWEIFEQLSYPSGNPNRKRPSPRQGRAGVVGISKATMLVTDGRVGPAFDSRVRKALQIRVVDTAPQWLDAVRLASDDVREFESRNGTTLQAASEFGDLHSGRIYDMALGPR
jgi:hypothetical protein